MEDTATPTHLGFRDRWITTGLVGIGLIVFAINGSTTNLVLSKIMTNLRVGATVDSGITRMDALTGFVMTS